MIDYATHYNDPNLDHSQQKKNSSEVKILTTTLHISAFTETYLKTAIIQRKA